MFIFAEYENLVVLELDLTHFIIMNSLIELDVGLFLIGLKEIISIACFASGAT